MRTKYPKNIFLQTAEEWMDDKAPRLGAALAFYSMLSLGPLLLLVLAGGGAIFGQDASQGRIVAALQDIIGDTGAHVIESMIADSAQERDTGIVASALGAGMLLFGASGVFRELQQAMNTIWNVESKTGRGIHGFLLRRFFSFLMVLGTGIILLILLVLSASLSALTDFRSGFFYDYKIVIQCLNFLFSFSIISLLFCLIFKYIPDTKIEWQDVWVGAVMTAFLFTLGKSAIGLYLGHTSFSSSYGAAGSLVVMLVWVYYSAQILFFGAEFTQVYANRFGKQIRPKQNAQLIKKQKPLNKRRMQRRILNRWENEGGAMVSGDPDLFVHDKPSVSSCRAK